MYHSLLDYLALLSSAKVLCVGDIMLDRFIYGQVTRISPEAPIPVFTTTTTNEMLGGAGNVINNICALGSKVTFLSAIGEDEIGKTILQQLQTLTPQADGYQVITTNTRKTGVKTRYIAQNQQLLRVDEEDTCAIDQTTIGALLQAATSALKDHNVLLFSDYKKGVLTPDVLQHLIAEARQNHCKIIIDPKGRDYRAYSGANIITPNRNELAEATGKPVETEEDIINAARYLITEYQFEAVLVTRGAEGMSYISEEAVYHLPTQAKSVFDVSGAGDTVVAVLSCCVAMNIPIEVALHYANSAAGIVVGKLGTATVSQEELRHVLEQSLSTEFEYTKKILTKELLKPLMEAWRLHGETICFTNGCFDLLHPGHISLLTQAKKHADRLIVGLNSDDSIKRLKGSQRPVQSEAARALVLSALQCVDAVVVFTEDTPLELIQFIKPHKLVKGADYTKDTVVGGTFVEGYGGEVVLVPLEAGFSTTHTLNKIKLHVR